MIGLSDTQDVSCGMLWVLYKVVVRGCCEWDVVGFVRDCGWNWEFAAV